VHIGKATQWGESIVDEDTQTIFNLLLMMED
jgi:hypothetical protein